jgi:hypothetical protein
MRFGQQDRQQRHLRAIARQHGVVAAADAGLLQPFIERFSAIAVPDERAGQSTGDRQSNTDVGFIARPLALEVALQSAGERLRRAGVKGWPFHRQLQRALAELAPQFGYTGFLECAANYDDPDGLPVSGRIDVVWADKARRPQVVFELDSTVKPASLHKLLRAAAPHRYWIYFGPDRWAFKSFCAPHAAMIHPTVIPLTFIPRVTPLEPS